MKVVVWGWGTVGGIEITNRVFVCHKTNVQKLGYCQMLQYGSGVYCRCERSNVEYRDNHMYK